MATLGDIKKLSINKVYGPETVNLVSPYSSVATNLERVLKVVPKNLRPMMEKNIDKIRKSNQSDQVFSRQFDFEFGCALDGDKENIIILCSATSTLASSDVTGKMPINTRGLKGFYPAVQHYSIGPCNSDNNDLNTDALGHFRLDNSPQPVTQNNENQQSNSHTATRGVSFGVNGSVGFMMGEPTGSIGVSWTKSNSSSCVVSNSYQTMDWSTLEHQSPDRRVAQWTFYQSNPFSMKDIPQDTGLMYLADGSVHPPPDLTVGSQHPAFICGWTVDAAYVKSNPKLNFMFTDNVKYLAFASAKEWAFADGSNNWTFAIDWTGRKNIELDLSPLFSV